MKNAMKKFFSIALALVLLVSVFPMQAAAGSDCGCEGNHTVYVELVIDGVESGAGAKEVKNNPTCVGDLITYKIKQDLSAYEFSHAWVAGKGTQYGAGGLGLEVACGETVRIAFKTPEAPSQPEAPETTQPAPSEPEVTEPAEPAAPITVFIKADDSNNIIAGPIQKVPANGEYALIKNLLHYCWNTDWDNVYTFDHAWRASNGQVTSNESAKIYAGDVVHIMLKTSVSDESTGSNGNTGSTNKPSKLNSNKVYLHIFLNNKVDEPDMNVNITNWIASDGKVDINSDVKTVVKNYYTAKDSDGIGYDGLYLAVGNWVGNFITDTKDEVIDNIVELKEDGYVHINIMITNAKAKTTSTSTADTTNPKTGDSIYMAVTVMAVSACALAMVVYFNKKRAVK